MENGAGRPPLFSAGFLRKRDVHYSRQYHSLTDVSGIMWMLS